MSEGHPSRRATILWPLTLVAAVHLLTSPGQWLLTDQAEYIVVADRLVGRGSLHLAEAGEAPPPQVPWVLPARPGQPLRSRLLPLTSIALAPLVLADRAFRSTPSPTDRPLVQLQGHLCVLAALLLIGVALAESGAGAAAVAVAIVVTGLTWPVWQTSRRGGAEAVYVLLVAVFLLGRARSAAGRPLSGAVLTAVACALLPWGNPTGAILGAALVAGAALEDAWTTGTLRAVGVPALAWAIGTVALVAVWNLGYHGNAWLGGYAPYYQAAGSVVAVGSLPRGIVLHAAMILRDAAPLLALAAAVGIAGTRVERAALLPGMAMIAAMMALFAAFPEPEPTRRMAAAWPAIGFAAGRGFGRLRWNLSVRQLLLAAAAVVGFQGFWATEGRYHEGPGGLFYPSVVWVRLWIRSAPSWQYLVPLLGLATVLMVAAARTSRLLAADTPANG